MLSQLVSDTWFESSMLTNGSNKEAETENTENEEKDIFNIYALRYECHIHTNYMYIQTLIIIL